MAVGVPLITPVEALSDKPAGSAGLTVWETLPVKLLPVNVEVAIMAVPTRPLTDWLAGLSEGAAITVMLTVAVAEPLVAPVPVMVWVVADWVAVGVPLITPVEAFRVKPADSAGLTV